MSLWNRVVLTLLGGAVASEANTQVTNTLPEGTGDNIENSINGKDYGSPYDVVHALNEPDIFGKPATMARVGTYLISAAEDGVLTTQELATAKKLGKGSDITVTAIGDGTTAKIILTAQGQIPKGLESVIAFENTEVLAPPGNTPEKIKDLTEKLGQEGMGKPGKKGPSF